MTGTYTALHDGMPTATTARVERTPTSNDRAVADLVHRALGLVHDEGRFGDRKVFISALWTQMRSIEADEGSTLTDGATLEHFKSWLLRAARLTVDGVERSTPLIVLSRADLVSAMDPVRVATSETVTDGATFHFALDPAVARKEYAAR